MRRTCPILVAVCAAACASAEPYDYTLFREHPPRSILVLPPLDNTFEVDASYAYLSTVTQPLAERGYYVFPVAVVDAMMRENGLPTPGEMHTVSLDRIADIFGADSVLFVTLTDWGTSYQVIDSSTRVTAEARLVDVGTGTEIWSGSNTAVYSGSSGSGGLVEMLVGAVVNQVASSISDPSRDVARDCNNGLFNGSSGLLVGPYHPDFGKE